MENKYLIIKENGAIVEAQEYLEAKDSGDFEIFVKREALGNDIKIDGQKSQYLEYAQKFGFDWEPNADAGFPHYDYRANLRTRSWRICLDRWRRAFVRCSRTAGT